MRFYITMTVLLLGCRLQAQQLNGVVIDRQTRAPLANALITSSKAITFSDTNGRFAITLKDINDTIRISKSGYSTYKLVAGTGNAITIELVKQSVELDEVKIFAKRDRVKDSLNTRAMFAKSFNSSAPKFKDIVRVSKGSGPVPIAGVTIIPSELIKAIVYKQSRQYKFKKTLLRDEEDKYVDSRFDKDLVSEITKLKADSLSNFMERYRPTIRKMTDYDLLIYIKKSLIDFKKE